MPRKNVTRTLAFSLEEVCLSLQLYNTINFMSGGFNNAHTFQQQYRRAPGNFGGDGNSAHLAQTRFGGRDTREPRPKPVRQEPPHRHEQTEGLEAIRDANTLARSGSHVQAATLLQQSFASCTTLEGQKRVLGALLRLVESAGNILGTEASEIALAFCDDAVGQLKSATRDYPTPPAEHLRALISQARSRLRA